MKYRYTCPTCGADVTAAARHVAAQRYECRACLRIRNGWTCQICGSTDPHHPSPCQ